MARSLQELRVMQSLPLDVKIALTMDRIREWVNTFVENGVYVSFSGGKDSTVLLHLVRKEYPNVKAVFSDTGLEFPELRNFVKTFDNVDWIKPEKTFGQIVTEKGYPLFGKEIAEAIWFARKIRGGGGTFRTTEQKRREVHGKTRNLIGNFQEKDNNYAENGEKRPFWTGKRKKGIKAFSTRKSFYPLAENYPF